jgi:hypothetical protein
MNEYANLTGASVMTRRNRTGRCFDHVIDGPTLMDMNRERKSFCVETLIPKGVCILGDAPKDKEDYRLNDPVTWERIITILWRKNQHRKRHGCYKYIN